MVRLTLRVIGQTDTQTFAYVQSNEQSTGEKQQSNEAGIAV